MHGHDSTQEAATTKAIERMTHIMLTFENAIGEVYETASVYAPKTNETTPYQKAVQMMLERELSHGHRLLKIVVHHPDGDEPWREEIDRLTLHIRAGAEAIAQRGA